MTSDRTVYLARTEDGDVETQHGRARRLDGPDPNCRYRYIGMDYVFEVFADRYLEMTTEEVASLEEQEAADQN